MRINIFEGVLIPFVGFWIGILFLLALNHLIPHLHVGSDQAEDPKSKLGRTTMMVLAVTLHNIPEGMAVGVMYAALTPRLIQPTTFAEISGNKSERTKQFYAYMKRMKKCGCKTKKVL